jgi:predicted thioesterase
VTAHDGIDQISVGTHERYVVDADKFKAGVTDKIARAGL